jgi:hypothetical protein
VLFERSHLWARTAVVAVGPGDRRLRLELAEALERGQERVQLLVVFVGKTVEDGQRQSQCQSPSGSEWRVARGGGSADLGMSALASSTSAGQSVPSWAISKLLRSGRSLFSIALQMSR